MIEFLPVTKQRFQEVFTKMTIAFPYEERRSFKDQEACLDDIRFKFLELTDNNVPVGFVALWDLAGFVFIEHIAIDEDKRGKGYGSKAIELIKETFKKTIILEAEGPETEQQINRIRFYNRLGFKVNDFDYEQPSYHGGEGVPLKILSFPNLLTNEKFENFIKETRNSAYKGGETK